MRQRIVMTIIAVITCCVCSFSQQCPPYTKNRDPLEEFTLGIPDSLYDGFALYRIAGQTGLYRTPLKTYQPMLVPGTQDDDPRNITISDDGEWVMYFCSENQTLVIQRLNGSGRTSVWMWGVRTGGFYRNSPYGSEIYYIEGSSRVIAVQVDLSGEQAEILAQTSRPIVDVGWDRRFDGAYSNSGSSVSGDQVYLREDATNQFGYVGRTAFITIPDSGRGTAGLSNIFTWTDTVFTGVWGCGHTMSHDGLYCLANSSLIGSACVPNRHNEPNMDHKGFYITKFWRDSEPPIAIDAIADIYGTSINWAPPAYRLGEYDEVDFTGWHFSNNSRYIIGTLRGNRLEAFGLENGLWVIDWVHNVWTRITPDSLRLDLDDPAIYFTDPAASGNYHVFDHARRSHRGITKTVVLPGQINKNDGDIWYTLDGRIRRIDTEKYLPAHGIFLKEQYGVLR